MNTVTPIQLGLTIIGSVVASVISTHITNLVLKNREREKIATGLLLMYKALLTENISLIQAQIDRLDIATKESKCKIMLELHSLGATSSISDYVHMFAYRPDIARETLADIHWFENFTMHCKTEPLTKAAAKDLLSEMKKRVTLMDQRLTKPTLITSIKKQLSVRLSQTQRH